MANPKIKPKKEVTDEELIQLAQIGATYEEMAKFFGTTPTWLYNNKSAIIDEAKSELKVKLRKRQLEVAFDSSDPKSCTMLIFLGKTMLGQRETVEVVNANLPSTESFDLTDAD
jgi:hypothetical protein